MSDDKDDDLTILRGIQNRLFNDTDKFDAGLDRLKEVWSNLNHSVLNSPYRNWNFNTETASYGMRNAAIVVNALDNKSNIIDDNIQNTKNAIKIARKQAELNLDLYAHFVYDGETSNDVHKIMDNTHVTLVKFSRALSQSTMQFDGVYNYLTSTHSDIDSFIKVEKKTRLILPGFYWFKEDDTVIRVRYPKNMKHAQIHMLTETSPGIKTYVEMPSVMWQKLFGVHRMSDNELIEHAKKTQFCAVCGRRIEVKESIERGIGPVCFEKLKALDSATILGDNGERVTIKTIEESIEAMSEDQMNRIITTLCGVDVSKLGILDLSLNI